MARPVRLASRTSLAAGRRRRPFGARSSLLRHVAARPVAVAVWLSLGGLPLAAQAGAMNPWSAVRGLVAPTARPVPTIDFTDASGKKQNIAKDGKGYGTVTIENAGTANETVKLVIDQRESQKAIYTWQSFDIGSSTSVEYLFANGSSSALNRVSNAVAPSQLFGSLRSYYLDASGKPVTGGEVFLINRNGILFGKGVQVNVGGLFASALDMSDEDYQSGMNKSIQSGGATFFKWVDPATGAATYDPETNYVKVEEGANITTASGGRVFLLGAKVENAGAITSPNGQVVLAAGSDVFLNTPSNAVSPLYMSEANVNNPAVKGLLVEVNAARQAGEAATNSGSISTPLGNTTIVGWAVNQSGRISATTGVNQNGSVFLQARSGVAVDYQNNGKTVSKNATQGGTLTLGPGSGITITPEDSAATVSANTLFTASRIELSGQTIDIQAGARITAPGAQVNIRAEDKPSYALSTTVANGSAAGSTGRVVIGDGAVIDVSGTTSTQVSVARNFVTTAALGNGDLKDAPIQKSGPLFHNTLTFDLRQNSPILGDTSAYKDAVQKTANEFLSVGGSVSLLATGSVAASRSSTINVSGGSVAYTSAMVNPSVLLASNGQRYTLNTAPTDLVYVGVSGQGNMTPTRFGQKLAPSVAGMAHMEYGYVQGSNGGALNVIAPKVVLDGKLQGGTVVGQRQAAGTDALAKASRLVVGALNNATSAKDSAAFGSSTFTSAVLNDLVVTRDQQALVNLYDTATYPDKSRVSAAALNASGFGDVAMAVSGSLTVEEGADLRLPDLGSLTVRAGGYNDAKNVVHNGIDLGGHITAHGGTVSIKSMSAKAGASTDDKSAVPGALFLHDGKTIDVSGTWVNQRLDGAQAGSGVAGGSVTLSGARAVVLGQGSTIDVSGGATMAANGTVKGSSAGQVLVEGNTERKPFGAGSVVEGFQVAGTRFLGYGMTKGGALTLRANEVDIVGGTGGAPLQQGQRDGALLIGSDFFTQGGFADYTVDGMTRLTVAEGTVIAPRADNWMATSAARSLATGSAVSRAMAVTRLADGLRQATNLSLQSSGLADASAMAAGSLTFGKGAQILGDARSKLNLVSGNLLYMDGALKAAGGQVSVALKQTKNASSTSPSQLEIGQDALIDVSGTALYTPSAKGQLQGKILEGGTVMVGVDASERQSATVLIDQGALLKADGAQGQMDVARALGESALGYKRQLLASDGGDIQVNVGSQGGVLAGAYSAAGGNGAASGGTLTVKMVDAGTGKLNVQGGVVGATLVKGEATVSTAAIEAAKFADVSLVAPQEIAFVDSLNWAVPRNLTLASPVVSTAKAAAVTIQAGSTLRMGRPGKFGAVPTAASGGRIDGAALNLSSGLVELYGQMALKGFSAFNAKAGTEIRLSGANEGNTASSATGGQLPGSLLTKADVHLTAPQITVSTASDYKLDATGAQVTIDGGDRNAALPLSAGARLTVKARTIDQNGVLRVPFGSITLDATERVTLGQGSVTSVSGDGLTVPYGSTTGGGTALTYLGTVDAPVEKAIVIDAHGQNAVIQTGATLDLSGGGAMLAYEFVPGTGGSKDVFAGSVDGAFAVVPTVKGYAPTDAVILADGVLSQASGRGNTLALGNTITFGDTGVLPAGTYAILPARYALLPGAYLVKPAAGGDAATLNYKQALTDGAYVVGGLLGTQGAAKGNAVATAYVVMSSDVAQRYSEIKATNLDRYFSDKAAVNGVAAPRLAADAGRVSISAGAAQLNGLMDFAHRTGLGGQLDLSSSRIHVGGTAQAGALNISYDQLNATGAESIVLGGVRQATSSDGSSAVHVAASDITVDADTQANGATKAITVGDITLAATGSVTVNDGVAIDASGGTGSKGVLAVKGDGALLRVSSDANTTTTRDVSGSGTVGTQGDLLIKRAQLKGGTVVAEATRSNSIASGDTSSATIDAAKLVVGVKRIVAGDFSGTDLKPDASTLVLGDKLAAQFNKAQDLSLRSFTGVDLYQGATLGGDKSRSLTIDTANLRVQGDSSNTVTVRAGQVQLLNTTGQAAETTRVGDASLSIQATGLQGGSGHITLGGGNVGITGAATTRMTASGSVVLAGTGSVSTPNDLLMSAATLTTRQAASSDLKAGGWLKLENNGQAMAAATPGAGARVTVTAGTIDQLGTIAMPSGALNLNAGYELRFGANSKTDLSGLRQTQDGVAINSMGGSLVASSSKANVTQAAGAVIDVSAGSGKGAAGSMSFSAPLGTVKLMGTLLARSGSGQTGGALAIDSGKAIDMQALANAIDAGKTAELANFKQAIDVRVRQKNQNIEVGGGTGFTAERISLSADAGDVLLGGALTATSQSGGRIEASAGGDVRVLDTARLAAHADLAGADGTSTGGVVALSSSGVTRADGSLGTVKLLGGAIDTSGLGGGVDGKVQLRATREALLADTSAIGTGIQGASAVEVEAFKRIAAEQVDALGNAEVADATIDSAKAYVADLFAPQGAGPSDAERIRSRLTAANTSLGSLMQMRAGVEITAPKDLSLSRDINLMTWRAPAQGSVLSASPVNLTLRAGHNLNIMGSISDGLLAFDGVDGQGHVLNDAVTTTDWIQPGQGGTIRLIGGADLRAANVMATKASSDTAGDVRIGQTGGGVDVMVRTTTGDIDIAAARDVLLTDPHAVVYTTGQYAAATQGYILDDIGEFPAVLQYFGDDITYANPFTVRGGSVRVQAGRDVAGLTDVSNGAAPSQNVQDYVSDWWWKRYNGDGTVAWWNRYDLFQQGFATFGGGDVAVYAGRDAWNVNVSAAGSGFTDDGGAHRFGGGSTALIAGRDIAGGGVFAADQALVVAGRDITVSGWTTTDGVLFESRQPTESALNVLYGSGDADVMARRNVTLNVVTQGGFVPSVVPSNDMNFQLVGLSADAQLEVSGISGDLALLGQAVTRYMYADSSMTRAMGRVLSAQPDVMLPATASLQAAQGGVSIKATLNQAAALNRQAGDASPQSLDLAILARDDLDIAGINQFGGDGRMASPSFVKSLTAYVPDTTLTGLTDRTPVRIESLLGDVSLGDKLALTQGLRLKAGQDIDFKSSRVSIDITHQSANELSLISAGRDLSFAPELNSGGINIAGPGDLVVATGRSINLNQSQGIKATGNRTNPQVPAQSANLTVLTGVSLDKGDVSSAASVYFELLGGLGVGDFAGDVYAQIVALQQGQGLPALGSGTAKAFASLTVGEQLDRARALTGDTAYQQRVLAFMRHREDGTLTLAQALSGFGALPDSEKAPMVGLLLGSVWSAQVPQAQQLDTALAMAGARGNPYTSQLIDFMQQRTGQRLGAREAASAFAALNADEQLLFSAKVLVGEMNAAVSKAAPLSGQAKNEAYLNAYNALDTMFPGASVSHADLQMGASTIQTQQGSTLNVLAPNGAVNVGQAVATGSGKESSASSSDASKLGLITAGGGDMAVVARDDVLVNRSRVFTVGRGDELVWSSTRNVDAGRGGKTVTAAASPVYYLDSQGVLQVDVTSAISGSGIKSSGKARIAAPKGEIDAGDAGITAAGGVELAANVILNANLIESPSITGAPPPAPVNAALSAPTPTQPTAAGVKDAADGDSDKTKKRRKRNVLLDFLGFGDGGDT